MPLGSKLLHTHKGTETTDGSNRAHSWFVISEYLLLTVFHKLVPVLSPLLARGNATNFLLYNHIQIFLLLLSLLLVKRRLLWSFDALLCRMVRCKSAHRRRAARSTMSTTAINSLLPNLGDHASTWRITANYWPAFVHVFSLDVGAIQATTVLSLVNLNTWLCLSLLFGLVEDIFRTLTFNYFAVHH